MKKWHHGHSLAAGVGAGLLLSYRPAIVFAAGVLCGVLAVGLWRLGSTLLGAFEAWRENARAKRKATTPRSYYDPEKSDIPY